MLRLIERILIIWAEGARRAGVAAVILFVALSVAAGFYAVKNLKVNTDTSEMLDPELPFQKTAAALKSAFPQLKNDLVVILRAPTLDEAEAAAAQLRAALIGEPRFFSAVFSPAEEPFFRKNGLLYLDIDELETRVTQMSKAAGLIETLVTSPTADTLFAQLADNDRLAARSELGRDTLERIYEELADVAEASIKGERRPFSWMGALDTSGGDPAGHTRIVYATPVLDYSRLQPAKPAIEEVRRKVSAIAQQFDGRLESFVTGDPALRAEELQSVTRGIGLSFLISFALVAILLVLCYRSFSLAVLTLASLVVTLTLTSGYAAMFIGELNLISIAFTVLLVGLGLDFAIHLLLHLEEHRGRGRDTARALRASLHEVGPGLVLAGLTTAIAFFSFTPTKFDGIAQLGQIAGVGVLIALVVSLTFLPAALALFPKSAVGRKFKPERRNGLAARLRGPLAAVTVLAGAGATIYLPQTRFDADPMSLRNPASESVRGFNMLFADPETVPYRLTRLVDSADAADAAADAARALPVVRTTRSLPDFVPDDQEEKLDIVSYAAGSLLFALEAEPDGTAPAGDGLARLKAQLDAAYTEGEGARLAGLLPVLDADAQAMQRLEDNVFRYWPQLIARLKDQLDPEPVDFDALPAALTERYRSPDGRWRIDILPLEDLRDSKALDRFVETVAGAFPDVSGGALQSKRAGDVISASMLEATLIALGVIATFLLLLVRRPTLVALMILPLALAAILTAATGVVLGIPFNYANVIVLPLLIGLGVDSGIHLVMRDQQTRAGEDVYSTSTPRAVLFSALTTIASFGSLMLSPHRGTASMGELLSISIFYSLLCALFVLPAAFALGERLSARR